MSRIEQITALLEKDSGDVFLNFSLAMELSSAGRSDEAIAQLNRVLQLDPDYISAHFRKSDLLLQLRRTPEARAALAIGIETARRIGNNHMRDKMQELLSRIP